MTTPSRKFKDAIYDQLGRVGKALASPRRLELVDLLCQGPRTVEALAQQAGQSLANTSQHLQVLRAARLVDAERRGLFVTYRLADERVCSLFRELRALAEDRLHEVEAVTRQYLEERGAMEPVDREALVARMQSGEVTLLDVRPVEEYLAGHLPGAISIPLAELPARLSELPRDREVVAYCRGRYCVLAISAVEALRARGYRAARLEDGVPDWRARGLPIAVSATEGNP
ncbi:MAG: ArsR family transcriptional regulator [Deltaproteobacteria bacterium RBG_16_71_12]|nr:MAG: ArsR family transcriptional regulator [Deltaproteobacteria bacterium RBG_16_71_12]